VLYLPIPRDEDARRLSITQNWGQRWKKCENSRSQRFRCSVFEEEEVRKVVIVDDHT